MKLRYMLDTDTSSYALRGVGDVDKKLLRHKPGEICVSALTVAELRFGASHKQSKKLHKLIDDFLIGVKSVDFNSDAAAKFGTVASTLYQSGTPIGQIDTLIAAHALSLNLILVTNNRKHHSRVAGLKLENWLAAA